MVGCVVAAVLEYGKGALQDWTSPIAEKRAMITLVARFIEAGLVCGLFDSACLRSCIIAVVISSSGTRTLGNGSCCACCSLHSYFYGTVAEGSGSLRRC